MGNFIAEFLVLLGLFKVSPITAALAALGLISAAIYALVMMQRTFQGEPDSSRQLTDYGARDMATMAVMIVGLVWLGVYPQAVFDLTQPVVDSLSQVVSDSGAAP